MFKNKKIVAMVLCALMLFVPVAAMAAPADKAPEVDYLGQLQDATTWTNLTKKVNAVKTAAGNVTAEVNALLQGDKAKMDDFNDANEKYEEALETAEAKLAEAEYLYGVVKGFLNDGDEKFAAFEIVNTKDPSKNRTNAQAEAIYNKAEKAIKDQKEALGKAKDAYAEGTKNLDLGQDIAKILREELGRVSNAKEAGELFVKVAKAFNKNNASARNLKGILQDTWKKYVAFATPLEVRDFKRANAASFTNAVKAALAEADKKDYVASKEGWRVVNKNEGDYLKDVAKVEVVTKDGKSTVKLYDAAGKELKLDRSLYIWIPVAKDTKVLGAKVDGKETTFSVFTVDNQKYVEVAAEF